MLIPFAHALVALPLVVRTLLPTLRGIPDSLRQAAGTLGAGWARVFREVDLPVMLRSLLVSMVFAFTVSLGEFGASSFLSTGQNPTIPVAIYRYISQPARLELRPGAGHVHHSAAGVCCRQPDYRKGAPARGGAVLMLEIRDITKSYEGKLLLEGISFTVREGETVCLLGESGSGKSTLLRIIAD
jgi:ABC-type transport system involved in cytochrome bd biosynthesis fused ATPase/permease subunit